MLDRWIATRQNAGLKLGPDVVVALGERWAESPRRSKKVELWPRPRCQRKTYRVWNWLPAIAWSRRDTFRRMRDWGIAPHPAYRAQGMADWQMYDVDAEGGPRTGCRACLYASHVDLCHQALVETNRGLFERVHLVEQITGRTWWIDGRTAKQYLDGARLDIPTHTQLTFRFQENPMSQHTQPPSRQALHGSSPASESEFADSQEAS